MAYTLSPLGKSLATSHLNINDPKDAIIIYLYEHPDPIEIDELVGETNSDETKILRIINSLLNEKSPLIKEV